MTAPFGETVLFIREEGFYPITLSGAKPTVEECADHARINPGTIRIESMTGEILWSATTHQPAPDGNPA